MDANGRRGIRCLWRSLPARWQSSPLSRQVAALVTSRAYRAEAKQRTAADANLVIASQMIDRMLSRVSHHEYYHGDLKQAETLAADATAFYDELLQHNDDPKLRYRAAEAQNDLARIWELTGNHEKAIAACRRGVELLSPLVAAYPDDGKYLDARGGCYLTLGGAQQHSNSRFCRRTLPTGSG